MASDKNRPGRLWDDIIPDTIVLPGRAPGRVDPPGEDLVFRRIPNTNYAAYSVEFGREKLQVRIPRKCQKVS